MPTDIPKPDRIWAEKIKFFCVDTDVLQRHRCQFKSGALSHLPQQLPDSMELLLPEVVQAEVMNHRMEAVTKAHAELKVATKNVQRLSGIDVSIIDQATETLDVIQYSQTDFAKELHEFVSRCNGRILPFDDINAATLFSDYFKQKPPFEERKKSEFPDAGSLQLLQRYAENNDTMGIVVSADSGWEQFAAQSDRLYCLKSLEELTALFVSTGRSVDDAKAKIKEIINQPDSAVRKAVSTALQQHLNDAEWDTSAFVPEIGDRLSVDVYRATLKDYLLSDDMEVWLDQDDVGSSWVMELTALISVSLDAAGQVYKWDSIDREFIKLASEPMALLEEIDVTVYLTLTDVRLDSDPEDWDIDVDISSAEYQLGWREVAIDMT